MSQIDNNLFSDKDLYLMSHNQRGRSFLFDNLPQKTKRKVIHENMHLMDGMTFTSTNSFPQLEAYTGCTDFSAVPFTEWKRCEGTGQAAHFFLDDFTFRDKVWCDLERTTLSLSKFEYVFTLDFSLWKDLPTEFPNKENIYRTRFVGRLWQLHGFNVIPTASWGGLLPLQATIDVVSKGGSLSFFFVYNSGYSFVVLLETMAVGDEAMGD